MPSTVGRFCPLVPYTLYPVWVPAALPPTSMRLKLTAGDSARMDHISRALGRLWSVLASKFVLMAVDCVSTTGEAPVTVMFSASEATLSSALTVAVNPSAT